MGSGLTAKHYSWIHRELLPTVWLLGKEPRFADVEEPDHAALRKAGMSDSSVSIRARKVKGCEDLESKDQDRK